MKACRIRSCDSGRWGKSSLCKEHWNEKKQRSIQKKWYLRRAKDERLEPSSGADYSLKRRVLAVYGKVCKVCGESRIQNLQLDHEKNNGRQHRNLISGGKSGLAFYRALLRDGCKRNPEFPMQTVCYDCHVSITQGRKYVGAEQTSMSTMPGGPFQLRGLHEDEQGGHSGQGLVYEEKGVQEVQAPMDHSGNIVHDLEGDSTSAEKTEGDA